MQSPNEAPAQNSAFYKALTGDPEGTGRPSEFFSDFPDQQPEHRHRRSQNEQKNLSPPIIGAFKYDLRLKPPMLDGDAKKSSASSDVAASK